MKEKLKTATEFLVVYVFFALILAAIFGAVAGTYWAICWIFDMQFKKLIAFLAFVVVVVLLNILSSSGKKAKKKCSKIDCFTH